MSGTDPLRGKRALVTGGNRGIGLEVVRQLRDLGMEVFLGARDQDAGAAAVASIGGDGIVPVRIDVADPASVRAARDTLGAEGIEALVNNAGIRPRGEVTQEDIDRAWQVNALGSWRATRAFLPQMRERGWGRIVNVSTQLASHARAQPGDIYALTKIAQNAMTRALAEDLEGTGILVNACSPGWCRTDMGGSGAPRSASQGAASIVWGVTLADDGPNGGFFQDGASLPW